MKRTWLSATVAAAAVLVAGAARVRARMKGPAEATKARGDVNVDDASRAFLIGALLPAWLVAGHWDYRCHQSSDIEHTSGTHESLTHLLMISTTGVGVTAALFYEVNELVMAAMIASALAHEAIVLWDVGYANPRRPPSPTEQHVHSFLEVLPVTGLAFTICLNPQTFARLGGFGGAAHWRLEAKRHPLARVYGAGVVVAVVALLFVPYGEEFVRCWRVDRTVLPRPLPRD